MKSESDFYDGDGCSHRGDSGGQAEKSQGDRMKKFFKNKKIMGSLITVVLLGFGVPHSPVIGPVVLGAYCEQVKCDA